MCRIPLAQGCRAGAGVRRLEHVAVIWQRVGTPHRRLSHAQQVLAGRQGQRIVFGAEIGLQGKTTVRKEDVTGREEEKCPETLATAIAISMAQWACTSSVCTGCTNGSTGKLYPSFCIVNKLSHRMNHRNRGSNTVVINHDYFRDMQRRHHASRPAKVTCFA